ncbi:uncharacterized protein L969DRAFT_611429 [Mixia osmundae IAM 14324]|uniref:Nucleosome assembly protein n=1 Tax=Mixia osmundae (strain CBS 9802 / IAM 14324 / JCM 22182 / KY 12970) TaxID=764103 RepID=G7E2G9_MIXOS|nr:uncharacterized protein L969DRAFT_611429 [Mixia osmundae IAM 14324]KEI36900.1 hypothetical protein L969DRAFT_611429 [Mixia osmundae IAM 14324]GAA97029.1 hypothetical protein E5Q_03704 [Mixia osmundae IAM 14324]
MSTPSSIPRGGRGDVPDTPVNTPAQPPSTAFSRPQVPSAIVEDEGDEDEDQVIEPTPSARQAVAVQAAQSLTAGNAAEARAALASHPAFAELVQGRLNDLVGQSSGYIESLPPAVLNRVDGLKGLQVEHSKIEAEFQLAILDLEKKFAQKFKPIYDQRKQIILGSLEPERTLVEAGQQRDLEEDDALLDEDDEEEEETEREMRPAPTTEQIQSAPAGVPEFWLTALKNHLGINSLITDRDSEALKFLIDLRVDYELSKPQPGFKLVFEFGPGAEAYFSNKTLEKTYFYQDTVSYEGDFVYDHAAGCDIKWKDGKNLTVKIETKKQRNKNTNQTRIIKKSIPTESFFTFFAPPAPPSDEDDADAEDEDDLHERLEFDYQVGEDLKERVIPRAVDYFTGKALRMEADDQDDSELFDDEEDDEDDDDEDELPASGRRVQRLQATAPPAATGVTPVSNQDPSECKQQ